MKKIFFFLIFISFSAICFSQNNAKLLGKAFSSKDSSDYYFKKAKAAILNDEDDAEYYFAKNAYTNDHNKLDSSIYYGEIALKKLRKINKTNSIFYVNNNLAKTYSKLGKYDLEKKYLHSNLSLAEKNKNIYWELYSYEALSNLHHDFEDFKNGVLYGKRGLKKAFFHKEKGQANIKNLLNVIAINYDDWGKSDSALYYHKKVFSYAKGKDTLLIASTYNNIGNTLLKQKKYKEAKSWLNRALKVVKTIEKDQTDDYNNYNYATIYSNLATIASEENDFENAEKLFKLGKQYAIKSNDAEKLRDFYYQSAKFNKKRKNVELAIADQDQYLQLRDSIYQKDRSKQVVEMETKYEVEKKEKELLQSKMNIAEKDLEIKNRNIQFLVLSLIALALLFIIYLTYKQQKLKIKQHAQEFQLKSAIDKVESQNVLHEQRLSISRDLHDNIGAQLTFIISSVDNLKYAGKIADEKVNTQLDKINNFTKETILELRDTIWAMNTDEISLEDLQLRMQKFIEKVKESTENLKINFEIEPKLKLEKFSSLAGINIYRTMQEAINNALKHANATEIQILAKKEPQKIILCIKDNGKGFDVLNTEAGNGLYNMRKRIEEIGGEFQIQSSASGTEIFINLNPIT